MRRWWERLTWRTVILRLSRFICAPFTYTSNGYFPECSLKLQSPWKDDLLATLFKSLVPSYFFEPCRHPPRNTPLSVMPFPIAKRISTEIPYRVPSFEILLLCVPEKWKAPTVRKLGHIYLQWCMSFKYFLLKPQLDPLHRHLVHWSMTKL